ncbi:class I SAM-dependent methyltransferase [Anthocerotibacter panamensis]|uniref:class I SAM-dependent methyltransferase n=1 Tax=Anthocerotibacter panamensis TaxID=2857077 RepID=UPI001C403FAB|nr:class I SAM-dependent methyltransferase [Anthocerotibacter panamensis]
MALRIYLLPLCLGLTLVSCAPKPLTQAVTYEERTLHDPEGIGKFYMGREIANVMGFSGAAWLERASREQTEQPERVLQSLDLRPTDVVADIGAGTGYFTFRISPLVPQGKVLAVDVQPEMITVLTGLTKDRHIPNVTPILGTITDPKLPAQSVDLALMVDTYHELSHPREMMAGIVQALKPGGRVVLIEYRGEDGNIPIKALHKMTQEQARREMAGAGLVWQETKNFLPYQHLMVFSKPTS